MLSRHACSYWHVLECAQFLKIPAVCKFGNRCLQTHSYGNSVGWQDPILGETPSSREQACSGMGNIGPTHGVIQTGSETQRNQNARTFGERYIEWTLINEEKMARTSALPLHNNLFTIPGSFSGTRFSKPSPACNASSFLMRISRERINSLWIQELHFVWWQGSTSYCDCKLCDANDRRNNTTRQWPEHARRFSVLERITRRALAGNIVRGEWFFVCVASRSAITSHQECEITSNVKPTTTFVWLSMACKQPVTRHDVWVIGSRHELQATMSSKWKQIGQNGVKDSRKDWQGDRQVRQMFLQLAWKYHRQHIFFPAPSSSEANFEHSRCKA